MHLQPVFAGARACLTGAAERLFERGPHPAERFGAVRDEVDEVLSQLSSFLGAHS